MSSDLVQEMLDEIDASDSDRKPDECSAISVSASDSSSSDSSGSSSSSGSDSSLPEGDASNMKAIGEKTAAATETSDTTEIAEAAAKAAEVTTPKARSLWQGDLIIHDPSRLPLAIRNSRNTGNR